MLHLLLLLATARLSHSLQSPLPNYKAAVIVPGFLTGEKDFHDLAETLTKKGVPSVVVPMPEWHWLPCVGGRSMRPMLERIDYTVRHVSASLSDDSEQDIVVPPFGYSLLDCILDFLDNPGGVMKVGGSDEADEYPIVEPRGSFSPPTEEPKGKIALIGHSAGGWISRIYLSNRNYGGKCYNGTDLVHSLITLGTPHADAPGPAFRGVEWASREPLPVRGLAVGSVGFLGNEWGDLTMNSYAFCDPSSDCTKMDGDSMTPIQSALALKGPNVQTMTLDRVLHYPWSNAGMWGHFLFPELNVDHKGGRPWYGDDEIVDKWIRFLNSIDEK